MKDRGSLTREARRIVAAHGVSLRQAYRYAASGRTPAECVRVGRDGRRYHVRLRERSPDELEVRRIRYVVASVAKRALQHGITAADLAELEIAAGQINKLAAIWKTCLGNGAREM